MFGIASYTYYTYQVAEAWKLKEGDFLAKEKAILMLNDDSWLEETAEKIQNNNDTTKNILREELLKIFLGKVEKPAFVSNTPTDVGPVSQPPKML